MLLRALSAQCHVAVQAFGRGSYFRIFADLTIRGWKAVLFDRLRVVGVLCADHFYNILEFLVSFVFCIQQLSAVFKDKLTCIFKVSIYSELELLQLFWC